jgi:hypothetical protein
MKVKLFQKISRLKPFHFADFLLSSTGGEPLHAHQGISVCFFEKLPGLSTGQTSPLAVA